MHWPSLILKLEGGREEEGVWVTSGLRAGRREGGGEEGERKSLGKISPNKHTTVQS